MDYNVIIITEADLSEDPAFVQPFRANTFVDLKFAVGEAIAKWRRYNPNRDFVKAGGTVLVEQAVFPSAHAVADEVV
jgi:hypothetical protein